MIKAAQSAEMLGMSTRFVYGLGDRSRKDLVAFQRWVVMGLYRIIPWDEFKHDSKSDESLEAYAA